MIINTGIVFYCVLQFSLVVVGCALAQNFNDGRYYPEQFAGRYDDGKYRPDGSGLYRGQDDGKYRGGQGSRGGSGKKRVVRYINSI